MDKIAAISTIVVSKNGYGKQTPVEEYPAYIQPTGAHDSYNTGDKVLFNGKKYTCKMDNCVWSPETYPAGWEEVVEESEG